MASYTIEDIEMIRRKSGISYQEAVALLDYHNGNVARALIDLERNGRIRPESEQPKENVNRGKNGKPGLLQRLFRMRVKVKKGDVMIANLSALFCGIAFLSSFWLVIGAVVAAAALGYTITYEKDDPAFHESSEEWERTVRNAAQNVRQSADDIARTVRQTVDEVRTESAAQSAPETHKAPEMNSSYYAGNPASATYRTAYTGSAPTIQVPVKVESTDGDVSVNSEDDGHNSATIG